jgi:hypothetical protein
VQSKVGDTWYGDKAGGGFIAPLFELYRDCTVGIAVRKSGPRIVSATEGNTMSQDHRARFVLGDVVDRITG